MLLRAGFVTTMLAGAAYVVLIWLPWPATVTVPGVVEYSDLSIVRSGASGFIHRLHVHDGMQVRSGDLLLELENDKLESEFRELESAILQADVLHARR